MIKRHSNIDKLKQQFSITNFNDNNIEYWEQLHEKSIQVIIKNGGVLPLLPPFEKHPYLEDLKPERTFTGLMIGTFPPITYLCNLVNIDKLIFQGKSSKGLKRPLIDYFHGNKGSFWSHTPFDFEAICSMQNPKQGLIAELLSLNIEYTDIIKFCQRNLGETKKGKLKYTAGDTDLNSIILNKNVIDFLLTNQTVNRLYFTNSFLFGMGENFFNKFGEYSLVKNDAFQLFLKSAHLLDLKIEIQIPNSNNVWLHINENNNMHKETRNNLNKILRTKAFVKLKLSKNTIVREFDVVSSVSPAATGEDRTTSQNNPCIKNYARINNISIESSPKGLLIETLDAFFNNDVNRISQYNA